MDDVDTGVLENICACATLEYDSIDSSGQVHNRIYVLGIRIFTQASFESQIRCIRGCFAIKKAVVSRAACKGKVRQPCSVVVDTIIPGITFKGNLTDRIAEVREDISSVVSLERDRRECITGIDENIRIGSACEHNIRDAKSAIGKNIGTIIALETDPRHKITVVLKHIRAIDPCESNTH